MILATLKTANLHKQFIDTMLSWNIFRAFRVTGRISQNDQESAKNTTELKTDPVGQMKKDTIKTLEQVLATCA